MTALSGRLIFLGASESVRRQFEEILAATCLTEVPTDVTGEDLFLIEASADSDHLGSLPGGNAFTACRHLKEQVGARVYLLVDEGDGVTAEIARFCLADGSMEVGSGGVCISADAVHERLEPHRKRVSIDDLLSRLEKEIASDEGRRDSALQRMLHEQDESSLLDALVDAETGLFDGPYTSFKLDEEFKRSQRFHQALSLLLLDIGLDLESTFASVDDRREFLAQVASVFLNECRDIDVIGRFTESTFLILMPGTGSAGAEVVARRMLNSIQEKGLYEHVDGRPAAGLATMPAAGIANRQALMVRAEACLQIAREGKAREGFCSSSE